MESTGDTETGRGLIHASERQIREEMLLSFQSTRLYDVPVSLGAPPANESAPSVNDAPPPETVFFRRSRPEKVSEILVKKKLTEGHELALLQDTPEVSVFDFPNILSPKAQAVAAGKMELSSVAWRRKLIELESVHMGPESASLRAYLLRYARGFVSIDAIMDTRFRDNGNTEEEVIFRGDPDSGTIVRLYQLAPARHGMDIYTIEAHAAYHLRMLRKLDEMEVRHIFYQEPWEPKETEIFRASQEKPGALKDGLRARLAAFFRERPVDTDRLFPEGVISSRLNFEQKCVLALLGAEKLYALLRPEVKLHSCLTWGECEELSTIIGTGKEKGSASFASRYMLMKTVWRLDEFFRKNRGAVAVLSMNPAHEFTTIDLRRFSRRHLFFAVGWPALLNRAEWESPNSLRKALANITDPVKQERIVQKASAVPLASYQHLRSGMARRTALPKLVGDISDLKGIDAEVVKDYLESHTPDPALRRVINGMAEDHRGIFRFIYASFEDPCSFREGGSPPWPASGVIAA